MHVMHELKRNPVERQCVYESIREIVGQAFPRPNIAARGHETTWRPMSKYLPQVMSLHAVVVASDPKIDGDLEFVAILADASCFYLEPGVHKEAVPLLRTAQIICLENLLQMPMENIALYPTILSLLFIYDQFAGV